MKKRLMHFCLWAADLTWLTMALYCALFFRRVSGWTTGEPLPGFWLILGMSAMMWTILFLAMRLDGFHGGWQFPTICSRMAVAVTILVSAISGAAFALDGNWSRLLVFYFAVLLAPGFVAIRYLTKQLLRSKLWVNSFKRVLIVGRGRVARELAAKIQRHPDMLRNLVGFLYPEDMEQGDVRDALSTATNGRNLHTFGILGLLQEQQVDEVIFVLPPTIAGTELLNVIAGCRRMGVQVSLVPHNYELYVTRPQLLNFDSLPVLELTSPSHHPLAIAAKRAFDLIVGSALLMLVTPVLAIAGMIICKSRGQVFTREPRCGKSGAHFSMYRLNVDRHATKMTRLECFLVRFSLTELPQLWNVIRGDMSLVGPRPETWERVKRYSEWQYQRLSIRPGITGVAQVQGLREEHSSDDKARFDLQYILDWSVLGDCALLLQTIWTLLMRLLRQSNRPDNAVFAGREFSSPEGSDASSAQSCAD